MDTPNTKSIPHSLVNTFQHSSLTQKFVTLGLLAFIFILPVSVLFLKNSTSDRPHAAVGDHPVEIQTPYMTLKADDFYIDTQDGTRYFFDQSTLQPFSTYPGIDGNNNKTINLILRWTNQSTTLVYSMYFGQEGSTWALRNTQVGIASHTFDNTDNTIQAPIGDGYVSPNFDQTFIDEVDSTQSVTTHLTNASFQPFLYTVKIPATTSGYFIENPPEGNTTGVPLSIVNAPGYLTGILRDSQGEIVTDQSAFTYGWETSSPGVTLGSANANCTDYNIQEPCPGMSIKYTGTIPGNAVIHLTVKKDDTVVAEMDFPVLVSESTAPTPTPISQQHPIDVSTPYVALKADNFYVEYLGQQYYFDPSTLVQPINSDPGSSTYTTLEMKWVNQGKWLDLNFYFTKEPDNTWSISGIRFIPSSSSTDTGQYFLIGSSDSTHTFSMGNAPLTGVTGTYTNTSIGRSMYISATNPYPSAFVYFSNISLTPFLVEASPTPTNSVSIMPCNSENMDKQADFNDDGIVNLSDYLILARDFLKPDAYQADANCDGKVNLSDYSILAVEFLK